MSRLSYRLKKFAMAISRRDRSESDILYRRFSLSIQAYRFQVLETPKIIRHPTDATAALTLRPPKLLDFTSKTADRRYRCALQAVSGGEIAMRTMKRTPKIIYFQPPKRKRGPKSVHTTLNGHEHGRFECGS